MVIVVTAKDISLGCHGSQCSECEKEPVGDYYESKRCVLCPDCYRQLQKSTSVSEKSKAQTFHKVRDCRGVHKHEFPGKDPKIIVSQYKLLQL